MPRCNETVLVARGGPTKILCAGLAFNLSEYFTPILERQPHGGTRGTVSQLDSSTWDDQCLFHGNSSHCRFCVDQSGA